MLFLRFLRTKVYILSHLPPLAPIKAPLQPPPPHEPPHLSISVHSPTTPSTNRPTSAYLRAPITRKNRATSALLHPPTHVRAATHLHTFTCKTTQEPPQYYTPFPTFSLLLTILSEGTAPTLRTFVPTLPCQSLSELIGVHQSLSEKIRHPPISSD